MFSYFCWISCPFQKMLTVLSLSFQFYNTNFIKKWKILNKNEIHHTKLKTHTFLKKKDFLKICHLKKSPFLWQLASHHDLNEVLKKFKTSKGWKVKSMNDEKCWKKKESKLNHVILERQKFLLHYYLYLSLNLKKTVKKSNF